MFICFPFLISKADFGGANTARLHLPKLAVFYYLCGLYTTIILYFCQNEFRHGNPVPAGNPRLLLGLVSLKWRTSIKKGGGVCFFPAGD
jgi:hypothetical protein